MDDNNLCELEIEEDGKRVRLKRNSPSQPEVASRPSLPVVEEKEAQKENLLQIKSPMV